MKILLDENIHHGIRKLLTGHDVFTVQFMGWSGVKNGNLLSLAESKFDVMVTLDSGIIYENNFIDRKISVITLISKSIKLDDLMPLIPELIKSLNHIKPGQVINIELR